MVRENPRENPSLVPPAARARPFAMEGKAFHMKLILHIGTEKTGSTSIQQALAADREALAARGILYPRLFGRPNHTQLAIAAADPNPNNVQQLVELQRQGVDHPGYQARLAECLREEKASGRFDQMIVSSEHFHSRLTKPDAIQRLFHILGIAPQDTRIVVYLRRQDRLAVSHYSTKLKLGSTDEIFQVGKELPYYFCFDRLLANWAGFVDPSRISVRLFEMGRMTGGDVVSDFYDVAGLGLAPSRQPRANRSLSQQQALFLRRFNDIFPQVVDGRINEERGPVLKVIRNVGLGESFRPPREAAEAFYTLYRSGNAEVRARYLQDLDRPTLFDEDFSEYPEGAAQAGLDEETLFQFIAAFWRYAHGRGGAGGEDKTAAPHDA